MEFSGLVVHDVLRIAVVEGDGLIAEVGANFSYQSGVQRMATEYAARESISTGW